MSAWIMSIFLYILLILIFKSIKNFFWVGSVFILFKNQNVLKDISEKSSPIIVLGPHKSNYLPLHLPPQVSTGVAFPSVAFQSFFMHI